MPDLATRMAVMPDAQVVDNSIFNPWAIFFRSDNVDDTYFQGNSCVEPCTNVDSYAHITTREPLTSAQFAGKRPIQRHQMVYAVLGDRMREEIHALSMSTLTPEEWAARGAR